MLRVQGSKLGATTLLEYWVPAMNQRPIQPQELQTYNCAVKENKWLTKIKGKTQVEASYTTHPITKALAKLFVFSFRKYMQAAKEIATYSKRTVLSICNFSST